MTVRQFVFGVVLALAAPATAQTLLDGHGPDAWAVRGVAADDVLNLRAGPSTQYPKIGWLAPDARGVMMLVCVPTLSFQQYQQLQAAGHEFGARWCLLQHGETRGWANASYLQEDTGGGEDGVADGAGAADVPAHPDLSSGAEVESGDPVAAAPEIVREFLDRWIAGQFIGRPEALRAFMAPDMIGIFLATVGVDPLFDTQDLRITDLEVDWGEVPVYRGLASVVATYRNFGEPRQLEFLLRQLPGAEGFVIIDVLGPKWHPG